MTTYSLTDVTKFICLPLEQLGVKPVQFFHDSDLHGAGHVSRVIIHIFRLCFAMNLQNILPECWAAAYLHDLARRHDGVCRDHGLWAVEQFLPIYRPLFIKAGVKDFNAVIEAVSNHSTDLDLPANPVCNILKDSDALDRCRIGDLDERYLRLSPTRTMISFAEKLYTNTRQETDWIVIWKEAVSMLAR